MQGALPSGQAALRLKWPSQQQKLSSSRSLSLLDVIRAMELLQSVPRDSLYFALNPTFTVRSSRTTPARWSSHAFPSLVLAPSISTYAGINSETTHSQG
ncbi:hypothetical protein ACHAWF_001623 [Thalassiosira exigua]